MGASTKQAGLANIIQHLMSGMSVYWRDYLGYSNFLDCSVRLYNFAAGDRFVNPEENPAGPAGGMSMCKTLQDKGDIRERIMSADATSLRLIGETSWQIKSHGSQRFIYRLSQGQRTFRRKYGQRCTSCQNSLAPNAPPPLKGTRLW